MVVIGNKKLIQIGLSSLEVVLIISVIILVIGGGWLVYRSHLELVGGRIISKSVSRPFSNPKSLSSCSKSESISISKPPVLSKVTPTSQVVIINYDNYGFDPNIVNVLVGTTVIVKNTATDGPMVFKELPYQANPNSELNLGIIEMEQEKSFVATIKGTWQFQNSNESSDRGLLITN